MKQIKDATDEAIKGLGLSQVEYSVDHPSVESHGDYAVNVAMILGKKEGKHPRELAQQIADKIDLDIVEKIEVAGPGFINFYLNKDWLLKRAKEVVGDKWEKALVGKKIAVEYTDPNPFKEFHIGHLYSNLIGESISKLYEANGATVWRGDFYGDVGMHIAKSVWGMMKKMEEEGVDLEDLEKLEVKERQEFMGQGYAKGVNAFKDDERVAKEVEDMNYMVYVASQEVLVEERGWKPLVDYKKFIKGSEEKYPEVKKVYQKGLKWSLEYFETYYERLGTKFDGYYPESWVGELGLQVVEKGLEMGVLEVGEEGAVVYKGEKDGLHTRVFRNKMGLPTYEAKDFGLVKAKYSDFQFDYSLNIFGKEIDEYYKVVKKALEVIEPELGKKQEHLVHGMVNLPEGKMSSRKGNVVTVGWLLNEARDRAHELMKDMEMAEEERLEIAEQVGQGAVKYALLKSDIGGNVTFDFGRSVSFEGNSGPYLQYTHARVASVARKGGVGVLEDVDLNDEEMAIARWLYRYPEVVVDAMNQKSPHLVCTYLYELAQRYNGFYNRHRILDVDDQKVKSMRLALNAAVAQVLKNGLGLLGIAAPSKM